MKFPTARLILTGLFLIASGILVNIASSVQSQYQAVVAAAQINNDSITGNALAFWFRNSDIVGVVGLLVIVGVLAWIWVPYLRKIK